MRFVDANVFIYCLVKSPEDAYGVSREILKGIEDGEEALTSTAVIQEVVDWLEYNNRKKEVKAFLIAVNSYLTLRKAEVAWEDMLAALDDMERFGVDFVDALTLQLMKKNEVTEIYSSDTDFDRVERVRRVWRQTATAKEPKGEEFGG